MTEESAFRLVAGALCVLALPMSGYYRRAAAKSDDELSRQEEDLTIMILLRLFGFSALIALLMYMIYPSWMRWSTLELPTWLRGLGVGLGVVTIPLLHWVIRSLGKNLTDTVATRREHTLVTRGPYRWVRHPLYLSGTVFWLALSLVSASWFIGLMSVLSFAAVVIRTPIEEAKLIQRFGDDYREYMERTGQFLPNLRCIRSPSN